MTPSLDTVLRKLQQLTAPEVLVLLEPGRQHELMLLKLLVLELMLRRSIRLDEAPGGQAQVQLLPHEVLPERGYERILLTALERHRGRMPLNTLLAQSRGWYGTRCGRLQYEMILPDLVHQGFLSFEPVGMLRKARYHYTPRGQYLQENLQSRLSQARNLAKMLVSDNEAASRLLQLVGSTALLLPELQPEHSALHRALFPHSDPSSSNTGSRQTLPTIQPRLRSITSWR
jgi:hypothetical protein